MKKFDNVKFEKGNPDAGIECYVDVLLLALDGTANKQLTPKENYEATRLYRELAPFKDKDKVELKPADFEKVKKAYNENLHLSSRNEEFADMYEYIESL